MLDSDTASSIQSLRPSRPLRWNDLFLCRLCRFAMDNRSCMFLFRGERRWFDDREFRQPELFAQFGFEVGHRVLIFFPELFGVLASLANAFAFVADPPAGFFQDLFS